MTDLDLFALLSKLGIRASRQALEALMRHASKTKMSPARLLEQLCLVEQQEREARNLARRIKVATLGNPIALDQFDWNHPRKIDRPLYEQLLALDFVREGHNVLFRGPAGVGKTTLAQHLGQRALQNGYSVRFSTLPAALADLLRQESLPATERRLKRYTRPDLLVLDELGYVPCDARAADLLFHIVSRRHEQRSVVIYVIWNQLRPLISAPNGGRRWPSVPTRSGGTAFRGWSARRRGNAGSRSNRCSGWLPTPSKRMGGASRTSCVGARAPASRGLMPVARTWPATFATCAADPVREARV
ncbi:MAG TPA: ATP-binding protein [Thermoleophilia bacterium]|nr:ATP-binding protein [Thermoleophilia bacterium]